VTRTPNPIPDGFHTATMYLCIDKAAAALDFYKQAFGAVELFRMADPDGRIRHAQFRIGDSPFMLSDPYPEMSTMKSVQQHGGSPASVFLYVEDADAAAARAISAGASLYHPIKDQEYGRSGGVLDPFGFIWWVTAP
jgi:PhnB protein